MFTSIGYHTFVKSKRLTQESAGQLLKDFKRYRNATGKIEIIRLKPYRNDPNGRHYSIVYPNQEKGLSWRLRFSSRGFCKDGEFTPCSIKVIINPKILSGERSYIVAANDSYLDAITYIFEQEAMAIHRF